MYLVLRENRKSEAVKSITGRHTLPLQGDADEFLDQNSNSCSLRLLWPI